MFLNLCIPCSGSIPCNHFRYNRMYMAYTTNPHIPRVRMEAVRLVKYRGWSTRDAARHVGYSQAAIVQWCKRDPTGGWWPIATRSSCPHHHPQQLAGALVTRILEMRSERNQCAEILHHRLTQEGVVVSLSSVKRVLKRNGMTRFSPWKKWHQYPPRPEPEKPGVLVQIDSMHDGVPADRLSAYALVDVCSRWGYAEPAGRVNTHASARFLARARSLAPFTFATVQSDHGSEFSRWFTAIAKYEGVEHRHSRVRTPTDNSHVERFIQTLQRECLNRIPKTFRSWEREIPEFLRYYNHERPHMALEMKTPAQVITSS